MKHPNLLRAALVAASCSLASAADLIVPVGGSIQATIDLASHGDRVLVPSGVYFEQLDTLGKAIEIVGIQGSEATVVDAGLQGRVLTMLGGEGPGTVVRGLTLTRGSGGFGPGGVVTNGAPRLEDCVITGNTGRQGGGVHGSPTLVSCEISNNSSSLNHGGGVWGAPTMIDCVVRQNTCTSANGGGLYLTGGSATLTRCLIEDNRAFLAGSRGGGLYVAGTATALLDRCVISGNLCSGGVFGSYGGGVFAGGSTALSRCTVVGNRLATGNGARVGGGVWGGATIVDSIVWQNDATQIEGGATVRYSDVDGGYPGAGNIDLDPLFWNAAGGDLNLRPGSPCIDSGDPASAPDPDGSVADMGAFPFDPAYVPQPFIYCSSTPNSSGLAARIGYAGSASLAANDLVLIAEDCAPQQFGLFVIGTSPAMTPLANGFFCLGGQLCRLPVVSTDAAGRAQFAFDNTAPLACPPMAGQSLQFQYYFRDGVGAGANLTDGLSVPFAP